MTPIEEPEAMQLSQKRTVACVLRSGGIYTMDWVQRLRRQVLRHHPEVRFVCLTDLVDEAPRDVEVSPLPLDLPGWWAKMFLWAPGQFAAGERILYLDLDTVIAPDGDLSPCLEYSGQLAMMRDFNIRQHFGKPGIGSAVVLWTADAMRPVWDAFAADPERAIREHPKRMDHFIRRHLPHCDYIQDLWPGLVACAKDEFRGWLAGPPAGARIICTWGRPRIPELPATHWYRRLWEEN
jgi:hypothetical protein